MTASFTFDSTTARVGEPLCFQITLSYQAHSTASSITLTELILEFEDGIHNLRVVHESNDTFKASATSGDVELYDVHLGEPLLQHENESIQSSRRPPLTFGSANLAFSPQISKVFELFILPRKTGDIRGSMVISSIREDLFEVEVVIPLREEMASGDWWYSHNGALTRRKLTMEKACLVTVQPKPPKLRLDLVAPEQAYYTDEDVNIEVHIANEEEEVADIRLDVRLLGSAEKVPTLMWLNPPELPTKTIEKVTHAAGSKIENIPLGEVRPSVELLRQIHFQALPETAEYVLEITANYHLLSDPATPITKTISKDLVFIGPFEASYEFIPRLDSSPWPSFFNISHENLDLPSLSIQTATGIKHKWLLSAKIASFAVEPLTISTISLRVLDVQFGAVFEMKPPEEPHPENIILKPNDMVPLTFPLEIRKVSLDDRRVTALQVALCIVWHRLPSADKTTTTILTIPSFTLPFSEPRVLLTTSTYPPSPLINLVYMIENPSMHMLTFQMTMEASEDFAFSGPKQLGLQLLPLSREVVRFNLLPTKKGVWIRPILKVLDVGFGQKVDVVAADGCESDGRGGVRLWVDAE